MVISQWRPLLALIFLLGLFPACQQNPNPVVRNEFSLIAPNGGIACSEPLAGQAGLEVLQKGGNAMDALVTVGMAMAVTYPRAGNLGGGGFIVYRQNGGTVQTYDFREVAPGESTPDMFWNEDGSPNNERSQIGALAAGIPGTVRGFYEAHQRHGKLPWKDLLQPAIRLARDGFEVNDYLHRLLRSKEDRMARFPASAAIFLSGGEALKPGDKLVQSDLAWSLEQIAEQGDKAFYEGEIAERLVAASRASGGIFSMADFAAYQAKERQPVVVDYRGFRLYSMPPISSGGLVLQGVFNTLNAYPLSRDFPHNGSAYIGLVSEVTKRWYAKRNRYLGDPDVVEIPYGEFSDPAAIAAVRENLDPTHPFPARRLPEFEVIRPQPAESEQTTHISILDREGNAVSMTYTLNGNFGSCMVAEGTGILLNNEMDDFAAKPGFPNMFGLVQGEANAVGPGKRMLSSMTPTIVEKDGQLAGLVGTPGGATIITSVMQIILSKIDYNLTLDAALKAGRFHQQWLPDTIYVEEDRFNAGDLEKLKEDGFKLVKRGRIGDIQAIWRSESGWEVCSDPRGNGRPFGY